MQALAVVLSIICPGLGHAIAGAPLRGLAWFAVMVVLFIVAGLTLGAGLVVALPAWYVCARNAAKLAG